MGTVIDELVIVLGFDVSKLDQGISQIGGAVSEVNAQVKEFGRGLSDGLTGAENQSAQTGVALAGVKQEAKEAGQALQEVGQAGAQATGKVESGARRAGKQVGFLGRQASVAGKRVANIAKGAIAGFAAGLAAPLLGALALSNVVKDYTEGLKRLEELSKKRNLSLKERQERQELLNKYSEKDIKLYRETSKVFDEFGKVLEGIGKDIMRLLMPAFAALVRALMSVIKWVQENAQHWRVLIPLLGVAAVVALKALATTLISTVIPAVLSFTAALLTNPLTWWTLALVGLGILLEDMITWLEGGESAFGGIWDTIAKGGDIIFEVEQWIRGLDKRWNDFLADLQATSPVLGAVLAVFSEWIKVLASLFSGDLDGAITHFKNMGVAAADAVKLAFEALLAMLNKIATAIRDKIAGAIDAVKDKASGLVNTISKPGNALFDKLFGSDQEQLAKINAQMSLTNDQARLAQGAAAGAGAANVDNSTNTTMGNINMTINAPEREGGAIGRAAAGELQKFISNNNDGVN